MQIPLMLVMAFASEGIAGYGVFNLNGDHAMKYRYDCTPCVFGLVSYSAVTLWMYESKSMCNKCALH